MLKRYIVTISALLLLLVMLCAAAVPGGADDPVVSLNYIDSTFIPKVEGLASSAAADRKSELLKQLEQRMLAQAEIYDYSSYSSQLEELLFYTAYMGLMDDGFYLGGNAVPVTLEANERLVVAQGGEFILTGGSARLEGQTDGTVVNANSGALLGVYREPVKNTRYIVASEDILTVRALSPNTCVLVSGEYQLIPVCSAQYSGLADLLKGLNLFLGTNQGYELEREATRLEALIMFLRLIGEEDDAMAYTGRHPFTDVPVWANDQANKCVAYAYAKGYTKGVSTTLFGTKNTATPDQYVTFVLRALGYSEGSDFIWNSAVSNSAELRVLSRQEAEMVLRRGCYRDMVVYLSARALSAGRKGGGTLGSALVSAGAVGDRQLTEALRAIDRLIY